MIVVKIATNKIRISSDVGLFYTPAKKSYRVIECPCGMLENIEEFSEESEEIAELLVL